MRDPVAADLFSLSNRLLSDTLGSLDWRLRDSVGAAWVPGVKPEDIKISVENNVLTIHGTKEQVAQERTERVHRYERTYGAFERSFTLPATVDASGIKASYEHGVLTVTLPKAENAKPRRIEVQVAAK